jgi:hypothetical protein
MVPMSVPPPALRSGRMLARSRSPAISVAVLVFAIICGFLSVGIGAHSVTGSAVGGYDIGKDVGVRGPSIIRATRTAHKDGNVRKRRWLEEVHLQEGWLIRSFHSWQVYLYSHGTLYPIPDAQTFHDLGYSNKDTIYEFEDSQLKAFPIGAPLGGANNTQNEVNIINPKNPGAVKSFHNSSNHDRGFVFCGGVHHIPDILGVVHQLRHIWKLNMSVTVAHCGEMDDDAVKYLNGKHINVMNMCVNETVVGMTRDFASHRLRGFFCKAAALVLSPYQETIISDLDVVFFKDPLSVLASRAYQETGAVYFRDKHYSGDCNGAFQTGIRKLFTNLTDGQPSGDGYALYSKIQADANGGSLYWRHESNTSEPCYLNFQDSSLIVFDKARHPMTLHYLAQLLPGFALGYGDKEIYWIANTMADEPFSFEPFLVATYGDCGVLLHFDPADVDNSVAALPLYINAEYIIEKIGLFGINLEFQIPNAYKVVSGSYIPGWGFYKTPAMHSSSCSCYLYGCREMPNATNVLLLRAQWERISRGWKNHNDPGNCINIFKENSWIISQAVSTMIVNQDCVHLGCLSTPVYINSSTTYQRDQNSFCDPVSFDAVPSDDLRQKSLAAQLAPTAPKLADLEVVKASGRAVYMYFVNDSSLHMIPNWSTFLHLNLDISNIHGLSDGELSLFPQGEDVWDGMY